MRRVYHGIVHPDRRVYFRALFQRLLAKFKDQDTQTMTNN